MGASLIASTNHLKLEIDYCKLSNPRPVLTWYKKKRLISYVKAWILRAPSMVVGNTKKLNNFPRH